MFAILLEEGTDAVTSGVVGLTQSIHIVQPLQTTNRPRGVVLVLVAPAVAGVGATYY